MRHSKVFVFVLCIALCVSLLSAALAESALGDLWNSGVDLLFHTDNVTADGEAEFTLDGVYFKTAKLHYVQDGYCSYYGLELLTPRKNGDIQKTGWTIIGDELGCFYAMEAFEPGVFRSGAGGAPHKTLLRRSAGLDALTALGSAVIRQVEPLLPKDMITVEEKEGGRSLRLCVTEEQIPDLAQSALNMAAGYLSSRWFGLNLDRTAVDGEHANFEDYVAVTQALVYGSVNWILREADVEFTLDAQGRMIGVQGTVKAASVFWDGTEREVEVKGSLAFTDFGASYVKPFDPDDYGVVTPWEFYGAEADIPDVELSEEEWLEWKNRAVDALEREGYAAKQLEDWGGWTYDGEINLDIMGEEGPEYFCSFLEDGSLTCLRNEALDWKEAEESEALDGAADADEAKAYIRAFTARENPALAENLEHLALQSVLTGKDGVRYLTFTNGTAYYVVRMEPSMQIQFFAAH